MSREIDLAKVKKIMRLGTREQAEKAMTWYMKKWFRKQEQELVTNFGGDMFDVIEDPLNTFDGKVKGGDKDDNNFNNRRS